MPYWGSDPLLRYSLLAAMLRCCDAAMLRAVAEESEGPSKIFIYLFSRYEHSNQRSITTPNETIISLNKKSTRAVNNLHTITKQEGFQVHDHNGISMSEITVLLSPPSDLLTIFFSLSPCAAAMANYHHCSHRVPKPQTRVDVCQHQSRHCGRHGAAGAGGRARA